jgi:hypothetical protein
VDWATELFSQSARLAGMRSRPAASIATRLHDANSFCQIAAENFLLRRTKNSAENAIAHGYNSSLSRGVFDERRRTSRHACV